MVLAAILSLDVKGNQTVLQLVTINIGKQLSETHEVRR